MMAFYCKGKKGICDMIKSSMCRCPTDCEFADGTGGYDVYDVKGVVKPISNADRFRQMTNEEQQYFVRGFWEIEDFADWLKRPYKEEEE